MTKKNITKSLHRKYSSWRITHLYPNIVHVESDLSLQIIVHHSFNLNVTVMYYLHAYDPLPTGEFYLAISGKRYTRLVYPFTFMSSNNSLEITFPLNIVIFLGIEYSIGQKFNHANYFQVEYIDMYLLWSYFLLTLFRIHVYMRARLALNTSSCLRCKLIVYHGPTGKLPILMKSKGTARYQKAVASTFQVFVVLIENVHQQDNIITFAPNYINTAVYNLSKVD